MKEGSPVLTTMLPLMKPISMAPAKANRILAQTGQLQYIVGMAIITPAKPIIEPIDKSNSPAIISKQAPMAMMPSCAETLAQFRIPSEANIPVSLAVNPKKIKTSMAPEIAPNSGFFKALLRNETSRTRSSLSGLKALFSWVSV